MRYAETIVDLIGNTPLVRLGPVAAGVAPLILAKIEYFNPGGSVKDRIAEKMITAAEQSGALQPGGTIVEPTSGNTGVGLALVAQQRGYHCIFVCPDKVSEDKQNVLRAYGAEVVVCPTAVAPEDPNSYYSVSDRLVRTTPGAWKPDQYANAQNPASHYETTGPEIWADTDGRVTHFVAGVGTGGTISGTGRYLKEKSGGRVQVIGADPEGSVYSGGTGRPYLVEGVGEDFWPDAYDRTVTDRIIAVSDAESFALTRRLAREEGLLVGGSCGMAVAAALEAGRGPHRRRHRRGDPARRRPRLPVQDLLGSLDGVLRIPHQGRRGHRRRGAAQQERPAALRWCTPIPNETIRDAVEIMHEYGVSQMPVVSAEPPVMAGEVVGSVSERDLLDALFAGTASLADAVSGHMAEPFALVGSGENLAAARAALQDRDAIMVVDDGKPAGVLTRADLLGFLAG